MTDVPLVQRALDARTKAHEEQAARKQRELDVRIQTGIRLMRDRLGVTTTADQWTGIANSTEAQVSLDGVLIHTWKNQNAFGGQDVLRTGEHEVRSLSHLGDLIVMKAAKLDEVPCPTCHGSGHVVRGVESTPGRQMIWEEL